MGNYQDTAYFCVIVSIDRTYKMYYGGAQQRPDAPYSRPIRNHDGKVIAHVGEGNRKDIRNAVEAAHRASAGYYQIDIVFFWWSVYKYDN